MIRALIFAAALSMPITALAAPKERGPAKERGATKERPTPREKPAPKERTTVHTMDGSKIEIRTPRTLIKEVKQVGPNHFEIKLNRPDLKKIEIKVTPPR